MKCSMSEIKKEKHLMNLQSTIGTPYKGKAYRADYGDPVPAKATAADVVLYERDELDNEMNVSEEVLKKLEEFPHRDVVWVAKKKSVAREYVSEASDPKEAIEQIELGDNPRIICEDGFEGFLVLRHLPWCDANMKKK